MNTEAEHYLKQVAKVKNVTSSDGELVEKAVRYMPAHERKAKQEDLKDLETGLTEKNTLPGHTLLTDDAIKNYRRYAQFLKKDLAVNVAPDNLSGETRDALVKRRDELVEKIKDGMLPHELMRRNPPGAVSQHIKWMDRTKDFQLEYKNIQHLLEPQDESEDLANIDMLRGELGMPAGTTHFDSSAQVHGHISYAHIPDDRWTTAGLPLKAENSPLAVKEREELLAQIEELKKQIEVKEVKPKRGMSEEKRAEQSLKMKAKWAAKKAALAQESPE